MNYNLSSGKKVTAFVDTPLGKIGFDERGDVVGIGFSMYKVNKWFYEKVK